MPQWMNFVLMAAAIIFSSILALFVALSFRKRKRRKRKHRRRRGDGERQLNPTLSQTGGLPPPREKDPGDQPPQL